MVVSGLPVACHSHARNVCNMALDMMDVVKEVKWNGNPIQVSILRDLGKNVFFKSTFVSYYKIA